MYCVVSSCKLASDYERQIVNGSIRKLISLTPEISWILDGCFAAYSLCVLYSAIDSFGLGEY